MSEQPTRMTPNTLAALRRYAQAATDARMEQCELCSEPIPAEHRHLLEVQTRQLLCVCRACSILFDREAASQGKYRLVPDQRRSIEDFDLSEAQWEQLRIPVDMAFFFHSTPADRVVVFYPSPMGATESLLDLGTWDALVAANPVLQTMTHDVEALLVNRARGARHYVLVPIEDCYRLVGLMRMHWRGLSGGQAVWQEIAAFFADLEQRSTRVSRSGDKENGDQP